MSLIRKETKNKHTKAASLGDTLSSHSLHSGTSVIGHVLSITNHISFWHHTQIVQIELTLISIANQLFWSGLVCLTQL